MREETRQFMLTLSWEWHCLLPPCLLSHCSSLSSFSSIWVHIWVIYYCSSMRAIKAKTHTPFLLLAGLLRWTQVSRCHAFLGKVSNSRHISHQEEQNYWGRIDSLREAEAITKGYCCLLQQRDIGQLKGNLSRHHLPNQSKGLSW